jgi:hypothetical protein
VALVSEIVSAELTHVDAASDFNAQPKRSVLSPAAVDYWLQNSSMYRSRSFGRAAAAASAWVDGGLLSG